MIKTKRLILKPISDKYKAEMCREFTPEVTRFMPYTPEGDIKSTEAFIKRSLEEIRKEESLVYCITLKDNDEFAGCCGLHHTNKPGIEIGIWVKKSLHGRGIGTETVEGLIAFANDNLKFDYLYYPVDKANLPSRSIPEKLGFKPVKTYLKKKSETENLNLIEYQIKKSETESSI